MSATTPTKSPRPIGKREAIASAKKALSGARQELVAAEALLSDVLMADESSDAETEPTMTSDELPSSTSKCLFFIDTILDKENCSNSKQLHITQPVTRLLLAPKKGTLVATSGSRARLLNGLPLLENEENENCLNSKHLCCTPTKPGTLLLPAPEEATIEAQVEEYIVEYSNENTPNQKQLCITKPGAMRLLSAPEDETSVGATTVSHAEVMAKMDSAIGKLKEMNTSRGRTPVKALGEGRARSNVDNLSKDVNTAGGVILFETEVKRSRFGDSYSWIKSPGICTLWLCRNKSTGKARLVLQDKLDKSFVSFEIGKGMIGLDTIRVPKKKKAFVQFYAVADEDNGLESFRLQLINLLETDLLYTWLKKLGAQVNQLEKNN